MEDSAETKNGIPGATLNGRHDSSWPSADIHYQLCGSNFSSGSSTNSASGSLVQHVEEASEPWQSGRVCGQDFGKGPEYSRPAGHKSSQVSPKLVVARSSGARRALRSHRALSLQDQWDALQGCPGGSDSSELGDMDTDTNLGTGFSTRLGLLQVPSLTGQRQTVSSQEFSLGRSVVSPGSNLDLYSGRISSHASGIVDYSLGTGTGQLPDCKGTSRSSSSSGMPLMGRSTGLASSLYQTPRNVVVEETTGDISLGIPTSSLFLQEQQGGDGQTLNYGNSSNFNVLCDPLLASGSNSQRPLVDETTSGSDSHFFLRTTSTDRAEVRDTHPLKGSSVGNSVPSSSVRYNDVKTSSRGSACKRKSCTSGLLGNSSCRSGSPHSSGFREGNGVRHIGGNGAGRRSCRSLGCASASDVVASASAVASGRCTESSVAASIMDESRSRKSSTARDGESSGSSRAAKSSSSVGTGGGSGSRSALNGSTGGHVDHQMLSQTQPPFARAVRRAIPARQPDTWCSQSFSLADCSSDTDFTTAGGGTLVRSTEQLVGSGGGRRSESPLTPISRSGSSTSSRRNDHTIGSSFGERLSHRYLGSSNRNMASGSSGGIGTESRLRVRNYSSSSADSVNRLSSAAQIQTSANMHGFSNLGSASGPSPSRLPPHPPLVRSRQNIASLQVSMLSLPSSGLAPSRVPPTPPPTALSLSSALEMLPSPSSIFQSSFLPRSSSTLDGHGDRGFGSTAESLIGLPFRGLQVSDGEHQPRLVAEGLAEILLALERVERDEDLTYEQLLMLEATLLFGGMGLHDQHSDLRLDVDNMSYEELLALEERIGNVSTGLSMDAVNENLKKFTYSSQAAAVAGSQESDVKCSVCQEEYEEGEELGKIDCGHSYHLACIKQWLVQKNRCPICKASALS